MSASQLDQLGVVEAIHLGFTRQELASRAVRGVLFVQRYQFGIFGRRKEGADLLAVLFRQDGAGSKK